MLKNESIANIPFICAYQASNNAYLINFSHSNVDFYLLICEIIFLCDNDSISY